ncbi:AraC family transcriptional regulator [Rhodococcus sp. NPDC003994]
MNQSPESRRPTDWDEVHDVVADAYFPHELRPLGRGDASGYRLESSTLGPSVLARIGFGSAVSIESDHPGAFGINIPLTGHLITRVAGRDVVSTPGQATINPPDTRTVISDWSESCQIIGFKVDRDHLGREIDRIAGQPGRRLPSQLDLSSGAGAEWRALVTAASRQAFRESTLLRNDVMARQLSDMLTTALILVALPPEESDGVAPRPRIVKRVMDAVEADPARGWTAGDFAQIAAAGARRLQQGFREYVGMTPMEYLLDVRLGHIHADLLRADDDSTVTEVAARWGLLHTGRFAAAYRRKYGVPPSATRRG